MRNDKSRANYFKSNFLAPKFWKTRLANERSIFPPAFKHTTLKQTHLSYSFKITQSSLPNDIWELLEIPEKQNQNFALILINQYMDNRLTSQS